MTNKKTLEQLLQQDRLTKAERKRLRVELSRLQKLATRIRRKLIESAN